MQHMNSCPSCGAKVEYGDKFCGYCGKPLQLEAPAPSPQHGYQYPNQQPLGDQPLDKQLGGQQQAHVSQQRPLYYQQSEWNQPTLNNQPAAWGNRNRVQQRIRTEDQRTKPLKKRPSRVFLWLVILIVVIFIIGGIALVITGTFSSTTSKPASDTPAPTAPTQSAATPPSSTPASPQPPPSQAPVLPTSQATPITATELIKAFADDPNGSRAKYNGNVYVISGTVSRIGEVALAILYLYDKAAGPLEIQCLFLQGQESDIASVNPEQSVKVEGRVLNFSRIIVVDNCRLVR
jgi:hypothetical protein